MIFDFDGTLVRSHRQVYEVMRAITVRSCPEMPSPERLRELSTREMMAALGVKTWQVPWFTFRARRGLRDRVGEIDFEPGLIEVLRDARRAGIKLALVSSNSRANVNAILKRHAVLDAFDHVACGSALLGKRRPLERMARRLGVPAAALLCVGDETRDIEAAHAAGLRSVAVGWGFHSAEMLSRRAPEYLVATTAELRAVLEL